MRKNIKEFLADIYALKKVEKLEFAAMLSLILGTAGMLIAHVYFLTYPLMCTICTVRHNFGDCTF